MSLGSDFQKILNLSGKHTSEMLKKVIYGQMEL